MDIINIIITTSLPVWLIIITGAVATRLLRWNESVSGVLGHVVLYITMPCLMILSLSELRVDQSINMRFVISYAVSTLLVGVIMALIAYQVFRRQADEAAMHLILTAPVNAAFLGIPIFDAVFDDPTPMIIVASYQVIFTNVFSFIVVKYLSGIRQSGADVILKTTISLIKDPLLISVSIGFLIFVAGLHVPELIKQPMSWLADATTPLILLTLGITLAAQRDHNMNTNSRREVSIATGFKLIAHPLLAGLIGYFIFGLEDMWLGMIVLATALPTAQNTVIYATQLGLYIRRAALVTTTTTVGSAITLTIIIVAIAAMGLN